MTTEVAALVVFALTYLAMALGRIPGLKLDRAGAALAGAAAMIACGAIPLDQAYRAIDLGTLTLLLGMMIVVGHLRLTGLFAAVAAWTAARAHHPLVLLAAIVLVCGAFSAFLVNDTVCLVLTPLVCDLTARLKRNPVPYLLGVAMASNAGSVATITGNPQNIMIGSFSRIPYGQFAAALSPIAAVAMLLTFLLLALLFRREFWTTQRLREPEGCAASEAAPLRSSRHLKALLVTLAMMAGFFAGLPPAEVAIAAAALMLITRRVESSDVYAQIDWPLLAMFAGLFIVVAGIQRWLLSTQVRTLVGALQLERIPVLSALAVVLSNVVSNVPAVLVLKPFVAGLRDPRRAWLALAMASTLAGNLTLVGSIANLIVARIGESHGVRITFGTYLKVGVPLTILSVLVGVLWL
ncbi:MAG TPA: SLC13 family permease [Steroidobacteraceae bacterium]|nr:SLC13 family permease [Steroidobacteraceae bacterium]